MKSIGCLRTEPKVMNSLDWAGLSFRDFDERNLADYELYRALWSIVPSGSPCYVQYPFGNSKDGKSLTMLAYCEGECITQKAIVVFGNPVSIVPRRITNRRKRKSSFRKGKIRIAPEQMDLFGASLN